MACKFRRPAACKASPSRDSRQTGLTLIELLVAISVLAFVAVLGWRGLDGIVRARIGLTGSMEQTRGMQLAFAQLQRDCSPAAPRAQLPHAAPSWRVVAMHLLAREASMLKGLLLGAVRGAALHWLRRR